MPRIQPLEGEARAQTESYLSTVKDRLGFVPNSLLTLGHVPKLVEGFIAFADVVNKPMHLSADFKQLIANMVSHAAGCRYCQAHTANAANKKGISAEKLEAIFEYQTSSLFSDAERAALKVAQGAGVTPNAVTDDDFTELKKHFNEKQIVELVALISFFGFLNRWNDTMATELESIPAYFAKEHLTELGWEAGKHESTNKE